LMVNKGIEKNHKVGGFANENLLLWILFKMITPTSSKLELVK
jgi:hypothetical protein